MNSVVSSYLNYALPVWDSACFNSMTTVTISGCSLQNQVVCCCSHKYDHVTFWNVILIIVVKVSNFLILLFVRYHPIREISLFLPILLGNQINYHTRTAVHFANSTVSNHHAKLFNREPLTCGILYWLTFLKKLPGFQSYVKSFFITVGPQLSESQLSEPSIIRRV